MSVFNPIELMFEFEVTPEQLFDWANKLEHYSKIAIQGQVIRMKVNSNFCFVYKPNNKKTIAKLDTPLE